MNRYSNNSLNSELTKNINKNDFFKFYIPKINKMNYNKNKKISEKLNFHIKKLQKNILEEKSKNIYFLDLMKSSQYRQNEFKNISPNLEKINNLVKNELIKKKLFFFEKKEKFEDKKNHYKILLKKRREFSNNNKISLLLNSIIIKIKKKLNKKKSKRLYFFELLNKIKNEKDLNIKISEKLLKNEKKIISKIKNQELTLNIFKKDINLLINENLKENFQSTLKFEKKLSESKIKKNLINLKEKNSEIKSKTFVIKKMREINEFRESIKIRKNEIRKTKENYFKKYEEKKKLFLKKKKEEKKIRILENINKIKNYQKERKIQIENARERYKELKKIIPLYKKLENNFERSEKKLQKKINLELKTDHLTDFEKIKKHEKKFLRKKKKNKINNKSENSKFLQNRSKSVILKKFQTFLERKNRQKNYSLFVKKNFLPKLTKNGKIRIITRLEETKERKTEKYKKEIFEKIEINKKNKYNFLKESLLIIKKKPKFSNLFIQKNLVKNYSNFSQNEANENNLRNSLYYKNYIPVIKNKKKKKNLVSILKNLKKTNTNKENYSNIRNDIYFIENEAEKKMGIFNYDINNKEVGNIDRVYFEIMKKKLGLLKSLG